MMTEEEILAKAYSVLGLEPGASLESINRRYKRLIMVWNPDRFPTADGKRDAEQERTQINDARHKLKAHFETGHKPSGPCACKASAGSAPASSDETRDRTSQGPGPGKRRTTQETDREEAEAQRRNQERARRTAEQAAGKDRQQSGAAGAASAQQAAPGVVDQSNVFEDERWRWKIARCLGVAWLGLSSFGCIGTSIKTWWHDVAWQSQQDHSSQLDSSTGHSRPARAHLDVPPYVIPPDNRAPGRNNSTPRLWQDQYADNAQPPPSLPVAPSDSSGVRQRGQDFLNDPSPGPPPSDQTTPVPVVPSNDTGNTFGRTMDRLNEKPGQL